MPPNETCFLPPNSSAVFCALIPNAAWAERVIQAGAKILLLRCRGLFGSGLYREIECSAQLAKTGGAQLWIQDYWVEAIECGAFGICIEKEDADCVDWVKIRQANLRVCVRIDSLDALSAALKYTPDCIAFEADFSQAEHRENLHRIITEARKTPIMAISTADIINNGEPINLINTGIACLALDCAAVKNPEALLQYFQDNT
ncbi:thiamine phosphate synthase [Stenoxybacter acetivorans]|uniref:thiamine phosphate synthase n=1 Tax=Stenoxybacter acetivorans TaxID=422441 RepID=UPI00055B0B20|nr:thiamine phosphate synthase [Stenoxybacter acetivorans]